MIAITGITGRIGGQLAERLLATGVPVRAVVRDSAKGDTWKSKGCEIAIAELGDVQALTKAFEGAEAVFVLLPPLFDPHPAFLEAYKLMSTLRDAIRNSGAGRVLYLSTVGAQAKQTNLLSQHTLGEHILGQLAVPVTFLRPAWFVENTSWDIASARTDGVVYGFLQPLDRDIPMVAIKDISQVASELIRERWDGHRIVELEGPDRVSPNKLAQILAKLLKRPVEARAVPRETWESIFIDQGMVNPYPRVRMLDGFNEGWIDFEGGIAGSRKGSVSAEVVLAELMDNTV
jgi:uncharacterized protein YbjT (DUF2867 family)